MRKLVPFVVLLLVLPAVAAWAESVQAGEFEPLRLANAPSQIAVDVPQSVMEQTREPFIIPKEIEFSTIGGLAFPEVTGGVSISYLLAKTEGGWAQFFVDAGGLFVEAKPFAGFLGVSTSLTGANSVVSSRVGFGYFQPLDWTRGDLFVYVRFPIGPTTETKF